MSKKPYEYLGQVYDHSNQQEKEGRIIAGSLAIAGMIAVAVYANMQPVEHALPNKHKAPIVEPESNHKNPFSKYVKN
jgi:hypothetical protein